MNNMIGNLARPLAKGLLAGTVGVATLLAGVVTSEPADVAHAASYPYPSAPDCDETPGSFDGCVADTWGFFQGQCTSWVAWRLNARNGVAFTNNYKGVRWGDASNWAAAARSLGIAVNSTPAVGAVAWYANHVAYVEAFNADGSIVLADMNSDSHNLQREGFTVQPGTRVGQVGGWPSQFIHIKDLTRAPSQMDYRGTILRNSATGQAWLIKSDGKRYGIPTGGDYQAMVNNGLRVVEVKQSIIDRFPDSGRTATVTRVDEPRVYERINGKLTLVYKGSERVGPERWIDRYTGVWYAYGRDAYFTPSAAGKSSVTNYFKWTLSAGSGGTYRIVAYIPKREAVAGVVYRIYDGSDLIKKVSLDQRVHYGWTAIATVKSEEGRLSVRLRDNEGSGPSGATIGADLIEVVPIR